MLIGLDNSFVDGDGFWSLDFRIEYEGTEVVNESFTQLADAFNWFSDRVINLGDIDMNGSLSRRFVIEMEILTSPYRRGFGIDCIIGNGIETVSARYAQPSSIGSVPEPGSLGLLGILVLVAAGRRRRV